jgi:hypothetical protein
MGYDVHITRRQNWFDEDGPAAGSSLTFGHGLGNALAAPEYDFFLKSLCKIDFAPMC